MIKFIYGDDKPVELDNESLSWRDAIHLEKVAGRKHAEFMKEFWLLDTEAQGICYWFALYLRDRDKAPRLSEFDFDIGKLTIEIDIPDRFEIKPDEGAGEDGEAGPTSAVVPAEEATAEPTAVPT